MGRTLPKLAKITKNSKMEVKTGFGLENDAHRASLVTMTCMSKRIFQIEIICTILASIVKIITEILKYSQNFLFDFYFH